MKKILLVILMLLVPKTMSSQTMKGTSFERGKLVDVLNSDSVVSPPSEPVVLEEPNAGDFLVIDQSYTGADTRWTVNFPNILNKFYQTYSDQNFDFIVLCPTKPMTSSWCSQLNRHIEGIGGGYGSYLSAPNLNALIAFDLYSIWALGFTTLDSIWLNRVLIHEIAHYWLVDIQWPQHMAIGHWQYNLDLFNGDTRYIDPMAYYHWVIKNGQEFCVDGSATSKFSDLSLYIMGLLPPDQVSPIYEHVFELKPGNDYYNMWGPACGDAHQFIETRTITIQDIINSNGIRNPSCEQSQKVFRIAFIIVTAKGETAPLGFIDYVKKYMDSLPEAWYQLTSGKSRIGYFENPQIVINKADIDFDQVTAKSVKIDTLIITNNSSTPLLIDSIYTDTKWFTVTSQKITLIKSDTLTLLISFTSDTMKTYSDTLYIKSNSSIPLTTIILKGQLAVPSIVLNQNTIDFGRIRINTITIDTLIITNNSISPLIIDSVYTRTKWFTGTSPKDTVSLTGSLKLIISFTPDTLKPYSDTLYIVNNSDTPLAKILLKGNGALTEVTQIRPGIPISFGLSQNYPNPFNPSTTINYQLPMKCHVTLKVFDVLGKEVTVLINAYQTAGYYSVTFNVTNLPSGVYFYRLQTDSFTDTKKILLLK